MPRETGARFRLLALVLCLPGCGGCPDGAGDRVVPPEGTRTDTVGYNSENPGAVEIEIPTLSLPEAAASPESRGALPLMGEGQPIVVAGSIRADSVRGAALVRVEFWQEHPRHGRMTTNEISGRTMLSDDETLRTYRLSGKTPHGVGTHNFEVSVIEHVPNADSPDQPATAIGPQVIATGTIEIK